MQTLLLEWEGRSDCSPQSETMANDTLSSCKSKDEEKRTPTTSPLKRKSDVVEKQRIHSPLSRSDRDQKYPSFSSLDSKKSEKGSGSADVERKYLKRIEKSVRQSAIEKSVGMKNRMDGRTYKSLFKQQRRRDIAPDFVKEWEKADKSSQVDISCCGGSVSKQVEDGENGGEECSEKMGEELRETCSAGACEEVTEKSNSTLRNVYAEALVCHGEVEVSPLNQKHSSGEEPDKPPEGDGLNASRSDQRVEETLDDVERVQVNCSAAEELQTSELLGAACVGRLLDGDIDEGTGDIVAAKRKSGLEAETDGIGKKCKKVVDNSADPASIRPRHKDSELPGNREGGSGVLAGSGSQLLPQSTGCVTRTFHANHASTSPFSSDGISLLPKVHTVEHEEGKRLHDVQTSLHILLQPDISKLCEILHLTEDVKVMIGRFLEYVIDNLHVNREPETILQAFQISLCCIAASFLKYRIDKKDSLLLAKKHLNFGCTEEEVNIVYSKLRQLKNMFLKVFKESESSKDPVSAAEDIMKGLLDTRMSQPVARCQQNVEVETEKRSDKQEFAEAQLLSQPEQAPKHKIGDKEISKFIQYVRKKCEKRMSNLIRLQQVEIQKFCRIREEERAQLEKKHKLDSDHVCSIHRIIPVRLEKLKRLDDVFAMKMEEHNSQKKTRLKDLVAKQSAERNREREKAARWLEEVKSLTKGEPLDELCFSESEVGGTNEHRVHNGPENIAFPVEEESPNGMQASQVIPFDIRRIDASGVVGCGVTVESPTLQSHQNHEIDAVDSMALHTVSTADAPENNVFMNPPCEVQILNGVPSSAQEVPAIAPNKLVGGADSEVNVNPDVQLCRECNQRDELDLSILDATTIQKDAAGSSVNGDSLSVELSLPNTPLVQPVVTPVRADLLPQNLALQDECSQSSRSGGMHIAAPASGNQNVLQQVEVPPLRPADAGPIDQTNQDAAVVSEHAEQLQLSPSIGSPVDQNQLDSGSVPGVEQPPCSEVHITSLYVEAPQQSENPAELSNQAVLQPGTDLAPPSQVQTTDISLCQNQPDLHVAVRNDHQASSEGFTYFQNVEASSQLVEDMAGLLDHTVPGIQLGAHPPVDTLGGFGTQPFHSALQATSQMPPQHLSADPLQNELERLHKETEQAVKVYEDMKLLLKCDYEKEIKEIIAEIRQKYETKLQDAEAAFVVKKMELNRNHNKVLMHKILADAFRCTMNLDLWYSGALGMQQVTPPNLMQLLHLQSTQPAPRPSPVAGSSSVSSAAASQHTTAPPVQVVHNPSSLFLSMPTRPPHIVPITPPTGSFHIGGGIRAPAPHLQPFRSFPSMSATGTASLWQGLPRQPAQQNLRTTSPSIPLAPPRPPPPLPPPPIYHHIGHYDRPPQPAVTGGLPILQAASPSIPLAPPQPPPPPPLIYHTGHYNRARQPEATGGLPVLQNSSLSALGLLVNVENQPGAHPPNILPPLPDFSSKFSSLDLSQFEGPDSERGSGRVNLISSDVATDVVYLSDDD